MTELKAFSASTLKAFSASTLKARGSGVDPADLFLNITENAGALSFTLVVKFWRFLTPSWVLQSTPTVTELVIPGESIQYMLSTFFGKPGFDPVILGTPQFLYDGRMKSQRISPSDWSAALDVCDVFADQSSVLNLVSDRGSGPLAAGEDSTFPSGNGTNPEWFGTAGLPPHTNPTLVASGTGPYEITHNSFTKVLINSSIPAFEYYGTAYWRDLDAGGSIMMLMSKWRATIPTPGFGTALYAFHTELKVTLT